MKKTLIATAFLSASALTLSASADSIIGAFWHFNDTSDLGTSLHRINPLGDPDNQTAYASDLGPLSARISVWGGGLADGDLFGTNGVASGSTANNFGGFVGTTNGDQGFGAGHALSIIGTSNNNRYFTIVFDDAVADLTLSYWTRGTGTGFDTHTVYYSTDGGASFDLFTSVEANQGATWDERIIDFGALFASSSGTDMNVIRIAVSGADGTSGNNRFDNVSLSVPSEPTPTGACIFTLFEDCPADLNGDGNVGVADLLALLACWGPVEPGSDCEDADLTGSGAVGVADLLELLAAWGECPSFLTCDIRTEAECDDVDGQYEGDDTLCPL